MVHGDTTTAMASALSAFYQKIKIGHVEAGLRTYNIESPFPEEFNRRAIGLCASYHYAPTQNSKDNLNKESINKQNIIVTGNTVIDSLILTIQKFKTNDSLFNKVKNNLVKLLDFELISKDYILITAHRRENINALKGICLAIRTLAEKNKNIVFVYPVSSSKSINSRSSL